MSLAIFDLDNTLLAGDSDYLWGQFLIENGAVDGAAYDRANREFYEQYKAGTLDIREFLRFALRPLTEHDPEVLYAWREDFVRKKIEPIALARAKALIEEHRLAGDTLLIITATNHFVTEPIARLFGVEHLLATRPEMKHGRFTGEFVGVPTFQDGKVKALDEWLAEREETLEGSWFYSDSHNDIPLLSRVDHPVAVDADPELTAHAQRMGWREMSLRF